MRRWRWDLQIRVVGWSPSCHKNYNISLLSRSVVELSESKYIIKSVAHSKSVWIIWIQKNKEHVRNICLLTDWLHYWLPEWLSGGWLNYSERCLKLKTVAFAVALSYKSPKLTQLNARKIILLTNVITLIGHPLQWMESLGLLMKVVTLVMEMNSTDLQFLDTERWNAYVLHGSKVMQQDISRVVPSSITIRDVALKMPVSGRSSINFRVQRNHSDTLLISSHCKAHIYKSWVNDTSTIRIKPLVNMWHQMKW
jgi:hypothetical protein